MSNHNKEEISTTENYCEENSPNFPEALDFPSNDVNDHESRKETTAETVVLCRDERTDKAQACHTCQISPACSSSLNIIKGQTSRNLQDFLQDDCDSRKHLVKKNIFQSRQSGSRQSSQRTLMCSQDMSLSFPNDSAASFPQIFDLPTIGINIGEDREDERETTWETTVVCRDETNKVKGPYSFHISPANASLQVETLRNPQDSSRVQVGQKLSGVTKVDSDRVESHQNNLISTENTSSLCRKFLNKNPAAWNRINKMRNWFKDMLQKELVAEAPHSTGEYEASISNVVQGVTASSNGCSKPLDACQRRKRTSTVEEIDLTSPDQKTSAQANSVRQELSRKRRKISTEGEFKCSLKKVNASVEAMSDEQYSIETSPSKNVQLNSIARAEPLNSGKLVMYPDPFCSKSMPIRKEVVLLELKPRLHGLIGKKNKDLLVGFCGSGCGSSSPFSTLVMKQINGMKVPFCPVCLTKGSSKLTVVDFWFVAIVKIIPEGNEIEVIYSSLFGVRFLECSKENFLKEDVRKAVYGKLENRIASRKPFTIDIITCRNALGNQHFRGV